MPIEVQSHDSPLGRWTIAGWRPAHLAGIVEGIWYFEGFVALPRERIFPDGRAELIVHLGPRYGQVEGAGRVDPYPTVCMSGVLLRSNLIEAPPGECAVLGVRLHPAGAYALLGRPLHDLAGITVDLADLISSASADLAERCAEAASPEARLRAAAGWIAERTARAPGADPAVAWTAAEIERQGGAVSISALRERTGWSKSRLAERFKEQIGVAPKVLARIVRFRRALVRLHRQGEGGSLADLALRSGYYDQPHFNAEFRELAGFSPGEYLAASRYPESVSLAEPAG
ncbi:MAG TPA: AraC family transcriptional regulator [Thermoanaerobaculia bacterium]|nr:AraC family transcriptional regulator [Thermoanaerobaculia bacterium]